MAKPLTEWEGTWEEIAAHAPDFAGRRVRVTVLPSKETDSREESAKSIEQIIEELAAQAPPEAWEKLPADLSDNIDHYIYGTSKQE